MFNHIVTYNIGASLPGADFRVLLVDPGEPLV